MLTKILIKIKLMNLYFITYGDENGNKNFKISKKHLLHLANKSGLFTKSYALGPKDLDNPFKSIYENILSQPRGGGYWIWKHRIIENMIEEVSEGDIVIYLDAGSSLNLLPKAVERFYEYIEILKESEYGSLMFESVNGKGNILLENRYTTSQLFQAFGSDPHSNFGNTPQRSAGMLMFKKNAHTKEFFVEYKKILDNDAELITDKYNNSKQISEFIENRHDQSIFSLISKKIGAEVLKNESEFLKRQDLQYNFPFLLVRRHSHGVKDKIKYSIFKKKMMSKTHYFQ